MKRKSIPKPTRARLALASNVRQLMENYSSGFTRGISSRELAKQIPVSYKTIDRIKKPDSEIEPNLETLDAIADFFGVETWQLLLPHHESTGSNNHQKR